MQHKRPNPSTDPMRAMMDAVDHPGFGLGADRVAGFSAAAQHILSLLEDAAASFRRGSFGTAVFLAITAMEEAVKLEATAFRRQSPKAHSDGMERSKTPPPRDPLLNHRSKHLMSVRETTFMGRLPALLGEETCARLRLEAEDGSFSALRETSLYFRASSSGIETPATLITRERATEIILLAVEVADDQLIGWTNASYAYSAPLDALIQEFGEGVR